jgi:hypothetical protein
MLDTQAIMSRGEYINIKITLNRNQNTPSAFLGAARRASSTPKDKIPVVKELLVMEMNSPNLLPTRQLYGNHSKSAPKRNLFTEMEEPVLIGKEPCVAFTSSSTTSPENTARKGELVIKALTKAEN